MIKKLSLALVIMASLVFSAGAAMTAFAENDGVSVSADASVNMNSDTRWDDKNDRKDGWMEERKDDRDDRTEIKQERRGFFDFFRGRKSEFKGDIRAEVQQTNRGLIEARWKFLAFAYENITARIESRIEKMKLEGKDTSVAAAHLANAQKAFAEARVTAEILAQEADKDDASREEVMEAKTSIKASLETAKTELRLSVKALVDIKTEDKE